MKAIVLCAGQGRRLLPLTETEPKCLLRVDGPRSMLEVQLAALSRCGVERVIVATGFGAQRVERLLATCPVPGLSIDALYNPFFETSDNLVTCWLARAAMTEDFVLLNGDTLFEDEVLRTALGGAEATVAVDRKPVYDADDMKVATDAQGRLLAIGKDLARETVNAESIGLLVFRDAGVKAFRAALEKVIRRPDATRLWFTTAVDEMARHTPVDTRSVEGRWWSEVDVPEDLVSARAGYRRT